MGSVGSASTNRRVRIVLGVATLSLVAGTNILRLLRERPWDPSVKAQQEAAEIDKKYAAKRVLEEKQDAERRSTLEAEEAKAKAREEEDRAAQEPERARLAALAAEAAAMTPAQRASKVRQLCRLEACQETDARVIAGAAKTPSERALLERPIGAARAEVEAKVRLLTAKKYEESLLKRGQNPDSVRAVGPGRTTFAVRGWFCSRQYMYDAQNGELGTALRTAGFKRIECGNEIETWTGRL